MRVKAFGVGLSMCPCKLWLFFYRLFGKKLFYHWRIDRMFKICLACKIHIKGHGSWCQFCGEKTEETE